MPVPFGKGTVCVVGAARVLKPTFAIGAMESAYRFPSSTQRVKKKGRYKPAVTLAVFCEVRKVEFELAVPDPEVDPEVPALPEVVEPVCVAGVLVATGIAVSFASK